MLQAAVLPWSPLQERGERWAGRQGLPRERERGVLGQVWGQRWRKSRWQRSGSESQAGRAAAGVALTEVI